MSETDPYQPNRKLGQGMIAIGFVMALGLLTWFFTGVENQSRNPNSQPVSNQNAQGIIDVVLQRNRAGHYVMTGYINGQAAEFILDTGATDVVIPAELAQASNLEYGYQSQAMTANGLVSIYNTNITELQLGDITLRNVKASINPAMHDSIVLLGMSALRQIEFTQRGSQLTLRYYPEQ